jgi:hypothetical protein
VSGKVLIDGEPLTFGAVVFVPEGGRQSTGSIGADGSFKLTCFEPEDGALVGTHHVQVMGNQTINNTTVKWHAPKKYADRQTSDLKEEIKGPTDSLVINLSWKGSPPEKPYVEHLESYSGEDAMRASRKNAKPIDK